MDQKDIEISKQININQRTTDIHTQKYLYKCFGITKDDEALGLRHVKAKVNKEFKKVAKRYHPDTGNNYLRGNQKLTVKQRALVRQELKAGTPHRRIAALVGVSQTAITNYNKAINSGLEIYRLQITAASKFKQLLRMRDRFAKLQIMPITNDNLEAILDITKGYKSTRDYVLPWD